MGKIEISFVQKEYEGKYWENDGGFYHKISIPLENADTSPEIEAANHLIPEMEVWERSVYRDSEGKKYYSSSEKIRTVKVFKTVYEGRYEDKGTNKKVIIDADYSRMNPAMWKCWLCCKGLSEFNVKVYKQLIFKDSNDKEYASEFLMLIPFDVWN